MLQILKVVKTLSRVNTKKTTKQKKQREVLKVVIVKRHISLNKALVRNQLDFSIEMMATKRQWNNIIRVW